MTGIGKKLLAWCERHYVKQGNKFTIEGREWVWDYLFQPVFGWKLWPRNASKLCDKCQKRIEEWTEWSPKQIRSLKAHASRTEGCDGLTLVPNMVTILNIQRGAGKTTNIFALLAACLDTRELAPFNAQFMSASGDQTETLLRENLTNPLEGDRHLCRRFETRRNIVYLEHRGIGRSQLECTNTTHRSNTGRRRDLLLIDEARDVPARAMSSLLPSIVAQSALRCPAGHTEIEYEELKLRKCTRCQQGMVPAIPRVVIVSTSGLDEGPGEFGWFDNLVETQVENSSKYVHVYRTDEAPNPSGSSHEQEMLGEVFGDVEGLRDYMAVELGNQRVRKGDSFLTRGDLERISNASIQNLPGTAFDCVAFLDTSWSGDKTSLLIGGWDPEECTDPWQQLRLLHWKIWVPKEMRNQVMDPSVVQAYLDDVIPMFPNLKKLLVDNRGLDWARALVIECNRNRAGWGKRVFGFHGKHGQGPRGQQLPGLMQGGGTIDRNTSWQLLEQRIASGPDAIAIPTREVLPDLHAELLGVIRKVTSDGGYQITDKNRKKRHADIAEGLAGLCLLAWMEQIRPQRGLADTQRGIQDAGLKEALRPLTGGLRRDQKGIW